MKSWNESTKKVLAEPMKSKSVKSNFLAQPCGLISSLRVSAENRWYLVGALPIFENPLGQQDSGLAVRTCNPRLRVKDWPRLSIQKIRSPSD